jgi:hypothetical protein
MRGTKLLVRMAGALLAGALTLTAVPLAAQQGGVPVDQIHAGSSLVALAEVPVRDRAPGGGALYVKGQQTGTLRSGEIIGVDKEQIVSTLLGNQKWVYFSRAEKLSPSSGWVLVGNAGTTSGTFGEKH